MNVAARTLSVVIVRFPREQHVSSFLSTHQMDDNMCQIVTECDRPDVSRSDRDGVFVRSGKKQFTLPIQAVVTTSIKV